MKIIPAQDKHLGDIQTLSRHLFLDEYHNYDESLFIEWSHSQFGSDFFSKGINYKNSQIYLAIIDNEVIGYIYGGIYNKVSRRTGKENIAEVYNMFVMKSYRSQGVGENLYNSFKQWCKKQEIEKISLITSYKNEKAQNFYKKIGFHNYNIVMESEI